MPLLNYSARLIRIRQARVSGVPPPNPLYEPRTIAATTWLCRITHRMEVDSAGLVLNGEARDRGRT